MQTGFIKTLSSALLLNLAASSFVFAQTVKTIRIPEGLYNHDSMSLIRLLLDSTVNQYGLYKFDVVKEISQGREVQELAKNRLIDFISSASNIEREALLLPIRIPIDMGLLGYRVCLIKKGQQDKFDGVTNIESLKKNNILMGQGEHWPDTQILKFNGLSVLTSPMYNKVFEMLRKQRFDCFPRSIIEVEQEAQEMGKGDFTIEKNLLFVYSMPRFLFVNKDNQELAKRFYLGFKIIKQDGRYYDYMKQHRFKILQKLNLSERYIIRLHNPDLSEKTRALITDKTLWYDPKIKYFSDGKSSLTF